MRPRPAASCGPCPSSSISARTPSSRPAHAAILYSTPRSLRSAGSTAFRRSSQTTGTSGGSITCGQDCPAIRLEPGSCGQDRRRLSGPRSWHRRGPTADPTPGGGRKKENGDQGPQRVNRPSIRGRFTSICCSTLPEESPLPSYWPHAIHARPLAEEQHHVCWRRVTLRATVSFVKIRHKGLRALHERDDRARLPAQLVPRLRRILFRLQEATHPKSADAPGFRLHPLKGDRAGQWSVRLSGHWRVVFRFEEGEAVDLVDYH